MENAGEKLVMEKFRKHGESARIAAAKKKAENEEKDRKMRERRKKEEEELMMVLNYDKSKQSCLEPKMDVILQQGKNFSCKVIILKILLLYHLVPNRILLWSKQILKTCSWP